MLLYEDHQGVVFALAFSPDGTTIASGAKDGSLVLRDADGQVTSFACEGGPPAPAVHALAFLPDGSLVVGHAHGWHIVRRTAETWREIGPSRTPTAALAVLKEKFLAVGTGDRGKPTPGKLELWDLTDGRRLEPHFLEPHGIRGVAVCPAKSLVAWATGSRNVRVCDIRRQKPLDFPQPTTCQAVALDPEGKTLAVALDRPVRLLDLENKRDRAVLKGHTGRVETVAFSPDGSTVVTGSWDKTVRLWDAASGAEKACFRWPVGKVFSLAFAPDGLRLAAGTESGKVVVWDVE
jgi:WD40 repeat protein